MEDILSQGGLWETKNHGNSFVSLFDNQMVMTIGDIKVDWQNDIIYVGSVFKTPKLSIMSFEFFISNPSSLD